METKTLKIAHCSDIHGMISLINIQDDVDLVVLTGDMFPNSTRGKVAQEVPFQTEWWFANASGFIAALKNKPIVSCSGNHDFVSLAELLQRSGYPNTVQEVVPGVVCKVEGVGFTGYRNIPWINGEWSHETRHGEMLGLARRACDISVGREATVLVTHTPPAGILAEGHYGCSVLANTLAYYPHVFRYHLFGHCHWDGGKIVENEGLNMTFSNAACTTNTFHMTINV